METIRGIVDHDTIRLVTPLALPQGAEIEFEPRVVSRSDKSDVPKNAPAGSLERIYELLSQGTDTGIPDLAARHNEHQP
jgi:hypothetical protein